MQAGRPKTVLITGANGHVGRTLLPALHPRYQLRLAVWDLDRDLPDFAAPDGAEVVRVDIEDQDAMAAAAEGSDAIVHLAGQRAVRATWDQLRGPNVEGVHSVLAAARRASVPKVVLASSNHAVGYLDEHQMWPMAETEPPRADSLYGVTKALAEVMGRFASDYWGLQVICLRIGGVSPRPRDERGLRVWLSPGDLGRLVVSAVEADVRFGVYYGVSANQRRTWNLDDARRDLGYVPEDDAEVYAADIGN